MRELLKRVWKKEEGFSLIELIIVIAILAIIAAIAVPNLLGNIQKANEATDESNGKLIADAISTFIATTPEYESIAIEGAATGDTLEFTTVAAAGGNISAGELAIINGAITQLNGSIPTVKSNTNGNANTTFHVHMTDTGVITVYEASGANQVFPN